MGIIVASFPGCGKEYLINTHGSKIKIFDGLSLMGEGQEGNYDYNLWADKIMENVNESDISFIPVNEKLLDCFIERNIDFDLFYPSKERRKEFIENAVRKRIPSGSIMHLDRDFNKIVERLDDIDAENCYKHKMTEQGQFIGNNPAIMNYIDNIIKENQKKNEESKKRVEEPTERVEESTGSKEDAEEHQDGDA